MTAATSQLAANTPEGIWARALSFRSAWTCSIMACFRWVLSAPDGVQDRGVYGGEERVVPVGLEERRNPSDCAGFPGERAPVVSYLR
jgi:hypothetical protein